MDLINIIFEERAKRMVVFNGSHRMRRSFKEFILQPFLGGMNDGRADVELLHKKLI